MEYLLNDGLFCNHVCATLNFTCNLNWFQWFNLKWDMIPKVIKHCKPKWLSIIMRITVAHYIGVLHNPYSSHWHQLMGISIARWLAASMWDYLLLFDFPLLISTTTFYSTHSAISMACAHVLRGGWKNWSALKSMNQLLDCLRGCAW